MKRKKLEKFLRHASHIIEEYDGEVITDTNTGLAVKLKINEQEKLAFIVALAAVYSQILHEDEKGLGEPRPFVQALLTTYAILRANDANASKGDA